MLPGSDANGSIIQWSVADGGNGHYYELVGDHSDPSQIWSWEDSKIMAESRTYLGIQGHLVTIANAGEEQFLVDTFHNANPYHPPICPPTQAHLIDSRNLYTHETVQFNVTQAPCWLSLISQRGKIRCAGGRLPA